MRQSAGFAVTHSVYSFFLLNVKETLRKGVLYPAKPIWEDIEFLHMVSESNLAVCKFNKYIHMKKHLRTPPPPPPPPTISLQAFLHDLSYQFRDEYFPYPTDESYKWLGKGSSVRALLSEHASTGGCVLVRLEMPARDNKKVPLEFAFSTIKRGARIDQFEKLIILVQYQEVDLAETPFVPKDADMLYWTDPPLSLEFLKAENGKRDDDMVHHDGEKYYVIRFDLATRLGPGSKRRAPDADSSTGGDGGDSHQVGGESKHARYST